MDYGDRFLPLRRQLGVTSFGMNQLVLKPGQRGRIHRHERQEEVYLVLEGRLTLMIESEPIEVAEGELIRVAPDLRRQLVNYGPGRVVLVALGGANKSGARRRGIRLMGRREPRVPAGNADAAGPRAGELRS